MKSERKGSITVFMSLMLMTAASLLFTLLEGSRYKMLGMMAVLESQSVTESMFAEYHVPAYQNYHLFMMDSSYGTGELLLSKIHTRMQELGQENLNPSVIGIGKYSNFLQMNVTDSSIVQYELATDHKAAALLKQVSEVMKGEFGIDAAQKVYEKIAGVKDSLDQGEKAGECLDGALDKLEEAKEAKEDAAALEEGSSMDEKSSIDVKSGMDEESRSRIEEEAADVEIVNPMEDVKSAKSSPLLAQILTDGDGISAKEISKEDAVERRTLNTGNFEESVSAGIADKAMVIQYMQKYLSSYRNKINLPHALAYEQEYLLFGKYTDESNLKKMAERLLLVREGINFAYLLSDSAKREEALVMATAIASAALIPAAATAIQMGLLASWAYAESIAELRTLFSGGKTAAVKTSDSWTVSLAQAAAVLFDTSIKSKEVSSGVSYEQYLQIFLALESMNKIGMRFANILEKNLRLYDGYGQVKLDCMITAMEAVHRYEAQQVFLSFVTIERLSGENFQYEEKYKFSYLRHKE